MKLKRFFILSTVILMLLSLLAGCGASSDGSMGMPQEAPMEEMMEGMAEDSLNSGEGTQSAPLPENRKWVITVNMQAETEDMDGLLDSVFARIRELNGYVEDQNIYNGSAYGGYSYRSAQLTVRIPADQIDTFTADMAEKANVVSNSKNLEDITLQYVDTETRMAALQAEEQRLLELMEQAETMADLLEIESRLTDVRYEKEQITSRLRTYDNQVNYATVYLNIEEVREYTPVEEPTVWERISQGFVRSIKGVGDGLVDFFVLLIVASPYLLIWGGIIGLIVFLSIRISRKKAKKKKNKGETPKTN